MDELRAPKYYDKIVRPTRNAVKPETLGPTTDAAQQHILCIYHQIHTWQGDCNLLVEEWGWKLTNRGIMPVKMMKKIAPPEEWLPDGLRV